MRFEDTRQSFKLSSAVPGYPHMPQEQKAWTRTTFPSAEEKNLPSAVEKISAPDFILKVKASTKRASQDVPADKLYISGRQLHGELLLVHTTFALPLL